MKINPYPIFKCKILNTNFNVSKLLDDFHAIGFTHRLKIDLDKAIRGTGLPE